MDSEVGSRLDRLEDMMTQLLRTCCTRAVVAELRKDNEEIRREVSFLKDEIRVQRVEMHTIRDGLQAEMHTIRDGLQVEMHTIRDELQAEMHTIRDGLQVDMHEIRDGLQAEMHEIRDGLQAEMHTIRDGLQTEMHKIGDKLHQEIQAVGQTAASIDKHFDCLVEEVGKQISRLAVRVAVVEEDVRVTLKRPS